MTSHWPLSLVAAALMLPIACGGSEPDATSADTAATPAPASDQTRSTATSDPCAMLPLAEWEAATGATGLTHSRDSDDTCDVLDDANARVAGSLTLLSTSLYDASVKRFEGEPVEGVGDQAYWVSRGPGSLYAKQGDRAFLLMVNPHGAADHREAAIRLARTALQR